MRSADAPVGRTWLTISGLHLVPDPQRTPAAQRGRKHAHQAAAVLRARDRFEQVDARDWLEPSGLTRLLVAVGFVDGRVRDEVEPVHVGPRTPSRDLTITLAVDHAAACTTPVDDLADEVVHRVREALGAVADRYGLEPFPEHRVQGQVPSHGDEPRPTRL